MTYLLDIYLIQFVRHEQFAYNRANLLVTPYSTINKPLDGNPGLILLSKKNLR